MFYRLIKILILYSFFTNSHVYADSAQWSHWVDKDLICIPKLNAISQKATLISEDIKGSKTSFLFTRTEKKVDYLKDFACYQSKQNIDPYSLIREKLVFEIEDQQSMVQDHKILDKYFFHNGSLGLDKDKLLLNLWAPKASSVELLIYNQDKVEISSLTGMSSIGVWQFQIEDKFLQNRNLYRFRIHQYYPIIDRFEKVIVTDPYSKSTAYNSSFSRFVDLESIGPEVKKSIHTQDLASRADHVIYETHPRDFSISDINIENKRRAKWSAFTKKQSLGIKHLRKLKEAGLNTIQFLPVNDFATVDDNQKRQLNLKDSFEKYCLRFDNTLCKENDLLSIEDVVRGLDLGDENRQSILANLRNLDGFNWGYDPVHYQALENSYSSSDDGIASIIEFKQAINELKSMGFRISLDVVFNHSYASGLKKYSVLDKVVPNYYHRRDPVSGKVYTSSCCQNTASENKMMEKLIIDTLQSFKENYKIDAFRFDLMGHHTLENMKKIKTSLGSDTYLYGEGWHFGEMIPLKIKNARQELLYGSYIGSFNDRFRDLVRGGSPFDCGFELEKQSYVTGLYLFDNEKSFKKNSTDYRGCYDRDSFIKEEAASRKKRMLHEKDLMRTSLIGNIRNNTFKDFKDNLINTNELEFRGSKIAYSSRPSESINYVSKHDNQTLWDNTQYKLPTSLSIIDRVKLHSLQLSYPLLSFGVPFIHMGSEIIRSKAFSRDSYNSGDYFNQVDFSMKSSIWKRAYALSDNANWPFMKAVYDSANTQIEKTDRQRVLSRFLEDLRIRKDLKFLSTNDAKFIKNNARFLNTGSKQQLALIVLKILPIDEKYKEVLMIFNNSLENARFKLDTANWTAHPAINSKPDIREEYLEIDGLSRTVLVKK